MASMSLLLLLLLLLLLHLPSHLFTRLCMVDVSLGCPRPTVHSPSSPHVHCPSTFPSFSSVSHFTYLSSSLFSLHIRHTFSWQVRTIEYSLQLFLGYVSRSRCPSNYRIPYSLHLCNTTTRSCLHIRFLLLRFLRCPCLSPVPHCQSYSFVFTVLVLSPTNSTFMISSQMWVSCRIIPNRYHAFVFKKKSLSLQHLFHFSRQYY